MVSRHGQGCGEEALWRVEEEEEEEEERDLFTIKVSFIERTSCGHLRNQARDSQLGSYMYALCVCLMCMPYVYALCVCLPHNNMYKTQLAKAN